MLPTPQTICTQYRGRYYGELRIAHRVLPWRDTFQGAAAARDQYPARQLQAGDSLLLAQAAAPEPGRGSAHACKGAYGGDGEGEVDNMPSPPAQHCQRNSTLNLTPPLTPSWPSPPRSLRVPPRPSLNTALYTL